MTLAVHPVSCAISADDRRAQALVSLVIVSVLGTQLVASILSVSSRLWPFTNYPMYARAFPEGDIVARHRLVGLFEDGTEARLRREDFGYNVWLFEAGLIRDLRRLETDPEAAARIQGHRHHYEQRTGRHLRGFRIEKEPIQVFRDHLAELPREVVAVIPMEPESTP